MIVTESFLTFDQLQDANRERGAEWTKGATSKPGLEFATIELGGEVGELPEALIEATVFAARVGRVQNHAKKRLRFEHGMPGGVESLEALEDELADAVICCSLLVNKLDIDLGRVVARKFNKTSEKHGFKTMLEPRVYSVYREGDID